MSQNILDLPLEIFDYIFQFLPAIEVYIYVAPTCQLFHKMVYSGRLPCLTKLILEPSHSFAKYPHSPIGFKGEITDEILITFSRISGPFLKSLTLKKTLNNNKVENHCRTNLTDKSLGFLLQKATKLERLELCDINFRCFDTIQKLADLPNLETLIFSSCGFLYPGNPDSIIPLPSLRELMFRDCSGCIGYLLKTENLESLYIQKNEELPVQGKSGLLEKLKYMTIGTTKYDSYRGWGERASIVFTTKRLEHCPNLEYLSLRRTILEGRLMKTFDKLESLEVVAEGNTWKESFGQATEELFPLLTELKIANDINGTGKGRPIFECEKISKTFPRLESLEIRNCDLGSSELETLVTQLSNLKRLALPNCRGALSPSLVNFLLNRAGLEVLDLHWCGVLRGKQASFCGEEIIENFETYGEKVNKIILRGIPFKYHSRLRKIRSIELTNSSVHPNQTDTDSFVDCKCGETLPLSVFQNDHRFTCPQARLRKFQKPYQLECLMCRKPNISSRHYESHLELHQERVDFSGSWICNASPSCLNYVLHRTNETESLESHHSQKCNDFIVYCPSCGEEMKLSEYSHHSEFECKST